MTVAQIKAIEYYLPEAVTGNEELAEIFSGWSAESIEKKLGIRVRHISAEGETSADMGVEAAKKLLARPEIDPESIDFLILCTQTPDYFLPTSACIVQDRLGLPTTCGALDFNLGCSGYVYGLSMAKGFIETGQAKRVLLITADTYTKFINPLDRASRPLFGDGAAATLIEATEGDEQAIGPFIFGTDGSGSDLIIIPAGGLRTPNSEETAQEQLGVDGGVRSDDQLSMRGPGVFSFAIDRVPPMIDDLLEKSGLTKDDVDQYVFHQANAFMLERLRRECEIPVEKFVVEMAEVGNTVSSTLPIAMVDAQRTGQLQPGSLVMLVGFGVGLSWGATLVRLPDAI